MENTKNQNVFVSEFKRLKRSITQNYVMHIFLIIPVIYFLVFKYYPMLGNIIAFRKYKIGGNYFGEEWSGFKYFDMFLTDPSFWEKFFNTIILSGMALVITFPLPIIFALLLNEVGQKHYKKIVQSVTIIPKFLSIVVVVMIFNKLLSPSSGAVNMVIEYFGGNAIYFMNESAWFRTVYIVMDVWQFVGWNSIIYMAVLASASKEHYEAAMVDGANRWKQTIHITLPVLIPTIAINFTIAVGHILNLGFEKILLIYQPNTYDVADVIQTYVYRMGLLNKNYSYATAVGLFQSLLGLILLFCANTFVNKYLKAGLW